MMTERRARLVLERLTGIRRFRYTGSGISVQDGCQDFSFRKGGFSYVLEFSRSGDVKCLSVVPVAEEVP